MKEESCCPEREECLKAAEKAMNLLLLKDRTRKELQERLYRAGFSESAAAYAMEYVTKFGYINDFRYAENYIAFHKEKRSRKELCYKLRHKGVDEEVLETAFESYDEKAEETALQFLLEKRLKGKQLTDMEYAEKNKVTAYLARKGFPISMIQRFMRS